MNYWVLIGVLIIVIGFALKLDVVAVVLISGLVTGLIADMPIVEVLDVIGKGFVDNRYMSLFFLSLPLIAIMERYGLKDRAAEAIQKMKSASAGGVVGLYILIRWAAAALSLRLGGHVQFVRPLILPMAEGAANKKVELSDKRLEELKGLAGAAENYGNFFGQNIFPVASGVLLIQGTLNQAGYDVTNGEIARSSILAGVSMVILALVQCYLYERRLRKDMKHV
ncbi:DUF969 domain-containing protein [Facklamia languida]|uniref:DUF969 domain-containing protein n=1 Tax=Facklamia languida CCUG 37842 TaxID=883113 RepID=H3NJE4_9LACT|nr:DUF969 domain-containing protein [Facklamia languida]EHR36757.1 hypothetical protein HMPREF9708_00983 [Facklamia languida CCUG 37842]